MLQQKKHIFNGLWKYSGGSETEEGDSTTSLDGMAFPNSPGVYFSTNTNDMIVYMNTYDNVLEEVTIPDIPVNKWINVILRNKGRNLDVYINGKIKHRQFLIQFKTKYGNVNVTKTEDFLVIYHL